MLLSDAIIFGTLPGDLLQSMSHGGVSCAFHGVYASGNDTDEENHSKEEKSALLASDASMCFTHIGERKQWRVQLKLLQQSYVNNVEVVSTATSPDFPSRPFSNLTNEYLKRALLFVENSWVCTQLSCPEALEADAIKRTQDEEQQNGKPHVLLDSKSLPRDITSSPTTMNVSTSASLGTTGGSRDMLPQASRESLLTSGKYRALARAIAHYLGPSSHSMKEILTYVLSVSSASSGTANDISKNDSDVIPIESFCLPTLDGRPAYHPEDVQEVVSLLASKGTSSIQFELGTEGYALIDLNQYDSRLTKQRVANRAFLKFAANSQNAIRYASQLRAIELYVDRDLFTRGRGIMSGLGTAKTEKRVYPQNIDINNDEDGLELGEVNKRAREEGHTEKKILAQYTDLSQCGIEWESGDLGLLFTTSDFQLHERMDLLKNRQAVRLALLQESLRQCQLPSMMIASDEQVAGALRDYQQLYEFYQTLMKGMESHSYVSYRARAWYDRIGPERRSASLMQQLKEWWTRQQQLREKWLPVYVSLQQETFFLEKEIIKYLDLRSLGVI